MVRLPKWGSVCVLVAVLGTTSPGRAQGPRAADWIADDAIAYLEVVSPTTLLDRINDPRIKAVLESSPDYNKAISSPQLKEFYAVVQFVAGQLDTTWQKGVGDLTGGGAVFAVEGAKSPWPPGSPSSLPRIRRFWTGRTPNCWNLLEKTRKTKESRNPSRKTNTRGSSPTAWRPPRRMRSLTAA